MNAEMLQTESTAAVAETVAEPAAHIVSAAEGTAGRQHPLVDATGAPLLPLVAAAIRTGTTLPPLAAQRTRSALGTGDFFPAVDTVLLARYMAHGRRLQGQATAEILLGLFANVAAASRLVVRVLGRALGSFFAPAPSTEEVRRVLGPNYRGLLGLDSNYYRERARYYGRGL